MTFTPAYQNIGLVENVKSRGINSEKFDFCIANLTFPAS